MGGDEVKQDSEVPNSFLAFYYSFNLIIPLLFSTIWVINVKYGSYIPVWAVNGAAWLET